MRVAVVTDGAAALPDDLAREWHVPVVAMRLEPEARTTSAPTPGDFDAAVRAGLAEGADSVLVVTLAARLSASWQSATVAARGIGEQVVVLDSGSAAGGQALVVHAAADAARAGGALPTVIEAASAAARGVALLGTVSELTALVASGRVPAVAGWAGRRLGVHPMFELHEGRVRRLRPARSRGAAVDRMVRRVRTSRPPNAVARLHSVVLHAVDAEAAARLHERLDTELGPSTSFVSEFGPVLAVHTGPGVLGVAWWWETARVAG